MVFRINGKNETNTGLCIAFYIVGSAFLSVLGIVVIPRVMTFISGAINKNVTAFNNRKQEQDDWGPVIVKKKS